MTESMKLSTNTEAAPIIASEGTSQNSTLKLLADRYAKRWTRIIDRMAQKHIRQPERLRLDLLYYKQAEAAVRSLYADAT